DGNPANTLYFIDVNGTLAIDNTGIITGSYPTSCGALLELSSISKGFLTPRMTTGQRNLICGGAPPEGLIVYNTTTHTLDIWNGSSYAQFWDTKGNAGTNPVTDFLGTTDNQNLVIKTNGVTRATFAGTPGTVMAVSGTAASTTGVNVDMTTNPVTAAATALNGTISGASGISTTGGSASATANNGGAATGLSGTSTVTSGIGTATGVNASATTSGAANGNTFAFNGSATSAVSSNIVGVNATATSTNPGVFGSVSGAIFTANGATNTDITWGVQAVANGSSSLQSIGGSFGAFGTNNNYALAAYATGASGTNIGIDIQSQGTNSIGLRVGTSFTPTTAISVTNATATGIDITGAPTSINASSTIQTSGLVSGGTVNSNGNLTVSGTSTLGSGGSPINKEYIVEVAIGAFTVNANSSFSWTITGGGLSGLQNQDAVIGEFSDPTLVNNFCTWSAGVTAANQVRVNISNTTGGNVNVPACTLRITVIDN
ncbi:MAG: hypothetical protein Q8916_12530, partial [Bacteroidota bacterium]|nr:hypothetical protein [Bacteroidota bacterium]